MAFFSSHSSHSLALNHPVLDPALVRRLSPSLAFRYHALPVAEENGHVTVAMAEPDNVEARQAVAAAAGLTLDRSRNELLRQDQATIRLTPLETRLLETLMINVGQVLPADMLVDAAWGVEGGDRAMLKQLIYRLQAKIEPDPSRLRHIETVPGVGYTLVGEPSGQP